MSYGVTPHSAAGWPTEEAMHIRLEITISEGLADRLEAECRMRKIDPAVLLAKVIELTIEHDLFAAVIDG